MPNLDFISHPVNHLEGEMTVPGDKSMSSPSIIFGAIANGTTTIDNFLHREDCLATLNAFKSMGVLIRGNPLLSHLAIEEHHDRSR